MDLEEIEKTSIYKLYEEGKNYLLLNHVYTDTDRNYRMYNGNQWEGAKIDGMEPAQYNIIETIVNYKVSTINQNRYLMHFNSENYQNKKFRPLAEKVCSMLDRKASKCWENNQMDYKIWDVAFDGAINDEGIMFFTYDTEKDEPVGEVIDKNFIMYGNEQSDDIESQPYILVIKRMPVSKAREYAKEKGVDESKLEYIIGDSDTYESTGKESKIEKDDQATIITKLYKKDGTVHYASSTKYIDLEDDEDTGLTYYPLAHFLWSKKKGWSRGEGEVRNLIPNQLELNKSLVRILLSIKQSAFPQKIVNVDVVTNPESVGKVGSIIKVNSNTVDDVSKALSYIQPTSMSTDVNKLISDLISITRDLKSSSDIATGGVNPEDASGKAILAVQQASKQPLSSQLMNLKYFIECVARIWFDMWKNYTKDSMTLEEEIPDPQTGQKYYQEIQVPTYILENLKGSIKIDVTPTSPYDKFAVEVTLENFLKAGYFNPQRSAELRLYAEALEDDSSSPKQKLLEICDKQEERARQIAAIENEAQMMMQRADNFLNNDVDSQASMINDYQPMEQAVPEQV